LIKEEISNNKLKSKLFPFLIILFTFIIIISNNSLNTHDSYNCKNSSFHNVKSPNNSGFIWARLDLTNSLEINNSRFTHYQEIPIEGRLYNEWTGENKTGNEVAIVVDGLQDSRYNDTTNTDGIFQINYTIDPSLNIYSFHKIEVLVISGLPPNGEVEYFHHYIINVNASSYFDIISPSPGIPGEEYSLLGYLSFDNATGIPFKQIISAWINGSDVIPNPPMNTGSDGTFPTPLSIPNDNYSSMLYLNLSYLGNPPDINSSQTKIPINLFRNITCVWNTVSTASDGARITIRGQVLSRNNTNLKINNRRVDIFYDTLLAGSVSTDNNGFFQFAYQDPGGTGNKIIEVAVINNLGLNIQSNTTHYISITGAIASETSSPSGKDKPKDPPFFNFFLVLIPIIIGGVAAFALYAYFFLKKQKEESMLVKLPLEGRIRNLKILKDTGRMEEALSYLFQSIYLELINAKYSRIKQATETIRDFAIISVKELNLNPASIYPFIQNVEKIIYDKPFLISEEDFYTAIDLFSPVYFELTGYNFILNF